MILFFLLNIVDDLHAIITQAIHSVLNRYVASVTRDRHTVIARYTTAKAIVGKRVR
jgi:hypothetical protein